MKRNSQTVLLGVAWRTPPPPLVIRPILLCLRASFIPFHLINVYPLPYRGGLSTVPLFSVCSLPRWLLTWMHLRGCIESTRHGRPPSLFCRGAPRCAWSVLSQICSPSSRESSGWLFTATSASISTNRPTMWPDLSR